MSTYFDTSFLVSLMVNDTMSDQARALIADASPEFLISDFARLEFASAISRRARTIPTEYTTAHSAFVTFDAWCARLTIPVETTHPDIIAAENVIRRLDTSLRAGDALHIAIAERLGATIATFDRTLAEAARSRGVSILS